tara:strand:- start:1852 stop:2379 length:528 start_codon:yes stop_codon:yes gene_type:complete
MFFILLFQSLFWGQEASVFEVRKTLPMSEGEKIYHDYYISAGASDGLKKGMLVTVKRNMPFKDTNLSKVEEDLVVDVAVLELIHVQRTFSVARLKEMKKNLVLEFHTVMIGDRIPLSSARMPSSATKKTAEKKAVTTKKVAAQVKPKAKVEVKASVSKKAEQPDVKISGEIPKAN